ncbi:MAG: DsrE family protein [Isosphaeraceae bacterium]
MKLTRRTLRIVPVLAIAFSAMLATPGARAADPGSKGHGKLVFVLTTGLEDLQSVGAAIKHSEHAQKSGYLDQTVLLVYGRSVQAFSQDIQAKPPTVAKAIKEASDAGVRIVVCRIALEKFNIPEDRLESGVTEVVPNAIDTLAELVSKGYQIIKY